MQRRSTSLPARFGFTAMALGLLISTGHNPRAGELERALLAHEKLAEEILEELVEYRTSAAYPEQTREAVEAMAARLRGAGFASEDVRVIHPEPHTSGLVARFRGTGERRPLLLMAHVDVVPADPDAWDFAPFTFAESEGYYMGRGSSDNKAGAATLVANFIRLKQEGFVPNRDLIIALTGDEEVTGGVISWLMDEGRELVDAELSLNTDAGGGRYDAEGRPQIFAIQTSEKVYQSFRIIATNPGGHSSLPRPDNAIYRLAAALVRLGEYRFPVRLNAGTRLYFERSAAFAEPQVAEDMRAVAGPVPDAAAAERLSARVDFNAMLRTTCVATQLSGGHAENALPRNATAVVNCRILPGVPVDEVEATLKRVAADEELVFERVDVAVPSPPTELTPELMTAFEGLVDEMWPGVPVIPNMSTGATDGLFVRNAGIPVVGISAIFAFPDDIRAHGLNERVGVREFHDAVEFWYRMLKRLSG